MTVEGLFDGPAPTVLVVDDEPSNVELAAAILEEAGARMIAAADGLAALEAIALHPPDAVLLDVMMPRLDGFEVCRRLKARRDTWFIPVVMLTALDDVESRVRGLEAGADEFLSKPIRRAELLARLRALLRLRALRDALDSTESVMVSMVTALEGKEPRWRGHSLRVAALAGGAARRLGIGGEELENVLRGALLHDLGKIGVPEEVLATPEASRTADQETRYRRHPRLGEEILRPLGSLSGALEIVRHHHERLDGSGYPDRLAGERLSIAIEVVAVADACDHHRQASRGEGTARELARDAEAGRFRTATVDAVIAAAAELDPSLDSAIDLSSLLPPPRSDPQGTILLAIARPATREVFHAALVESGNTVHHVDPGDAVLEAIERRSPDLVILDLRFASDEGVAVCRELRRDPRLEQLSVILLAAESEARERDLALAAGADDFLTVPSDRHELQARVRCLLRLRSYRRDLEAGETVILSLSSLLEAKDRYTNGHSRRVAELAASLVLEVDGGAELAAAVELGGLLHDIGKVAVPERLLHKPGPLDELESAVVRSHPVVGWEICRSLNTMARALPAIRWHHERLDGSGYPDRLAGAAIPAEARFVGLADAWDALTSQRSYRDAVAAPRALEILRDETARGHWDRTLFTALEARFHRGGLGSRPPA